MTLALLTERRYVSCEAPLGDHYLSNILEDDRLLSAALARHGIVAERVDWADPTVDWSRFDAAVFRTTWDYFDRFAEFSAWLAHAEQRTRLLNVPELLWWNVDKHYLADLEKRGVAIVASRFLETGTTVALAEVLAACGWDEAVVKPCISGGARHTYRLNRATAAAHDPLLNTLLAQEAFLLQPLVESVLTEGEDSLLVFGGRVTHAVRKIAKPGDFRVQDDHGGTVHPHRPTPEQIAFAERAVAACSPAPLYARVDLVRDNAGELALMELELVEPELWLRMHPPAATIFADALVTALASLPSPSSPDAAG